MGVISGDLSCPGVPSTPCRLQKTMPSFSQVNRLLEISLWHAAVVGGSSSSAAFCSPQRCVCQVTCSFSPFSRVFPFSHLAAVAHKTLPVKGSAPDVAQVRHRGGGGWSLPGRPEEGSIRALPAQMCHHWGEYAPAGRGADSQALPRAAPLWECRDCCSQLCLLERAALLDPAKTQRSLRTAAPDPVKHLLITFPSKCFKSKHLSI